MIQTCTYPSPIGLLRLAEKDRALIGLWLENHKYYPTGWENWKENDHAAAISAAKAWLDRYFRGEAPDPRALPLAPDGSAFRKAVWSALLEIPYGETITYGALSQVVAPRLGLARMSAQAIGGAVGHNPISIIIPCHRVVGADGSLTGYAGGLEQKIRLLSLEGHRIENDHIWRSKP